MTGIVDFRASLTDKNGLSIDAGNRLPVDGDGAGESLLAPYALNDFADGVPLYLGKVKLDGTWLVQKYDSGTGEMRYANNSNNTLITNYASAWGSRATLTYGLFQTLTGI
jgi:hypothetical protein